MADIDLSMSVLVADDEISPYLQQLNAKLFEAILKGINTSVNRAVRTAKSAYNSSHVEVTKERTENGFAVVANGEAVCFLEFGAGINTESNEMGNDLSISIEPGSWSKDHAGTYQKWVEEGKDMSKYPFNRIPKKGMYKAYKSILTHYKEDIKKELDKL